jgi:hypothetical protein
MAMFVHLAPARKLAAIQRGGLRAGTRGLFAMPVTPNFVVTHQWLREMRRRIGRDVVAIYFRLAGDTLVRAGRYGTPGEEMTADQAVGRLMESGELGFEVIIPHDVAARAITQTRRLRLVTGWRYYPGAHGRAPCPCPACQRGEYKGRKIRRKAYGEFSWTSPTGAWPLIRTAGV